MRVKEVYANGAGYTRVCMLNENNERVEYTVNEYTLHTRAYDFPHTHISMGRDIEVDEEVLEIVKDAYNKHWVAWNEKYPEHAKELFKTA